MVASGAAQRCEIQLAYAIGVSEPVSIWVDTRGTGAVPDHQIAEAVGEVFDFRPAAIIRDLRLRTPIFAPASAYGHFGRAPSQVERLGRQVKIFPWEETDRVDQLSAALNL